MTQITHFDVGDEWTPQASFTVNGAPTDPTTITVRVKHPDDTVGVLGPVDGSTGGGGITRVSIGVYTVIVVLDAVGYWHTRFEGTGAATATDEHEAYVVPSQFSDPGQRAYLGLEEFKSTLELTGTSFAEADAWRALVAASRGIDHALGRRFWLDDDNTQVRHYTAQLWDRVLVDDLSDLTALSTDDDGDGIYETVWSEGTDFVLEPINAAANGVPYTTIRRLTTGSYKWPSYPNSIRVEGQFGWAEAPEAIRTLTSLVAVRLLKRLREAPFGVVTIGLEGNPVRELGLERDPEFQFLAAPYRNFVLVA